MRSAWTDDNLWWLVLAGAAWLLQRVKAAQKKAAQTKPGGGRPPAGGEAERTRRVREDIRRRVEERLAGRGISLPPEPPRREAPPAPPPLYAPADSEAVAAPPDVNDLAERLRALRAADAATRVREEVAAFAAPDAPPAAGPEAPPAQLSPWQAALREPGSARRAIVLREILGPPAAFRTR